MTYTLIVDDERSIPDIYFKEKMNRVYLNDDILLVRNTHDFYESLILKGMPHTVSFDHDLSLDEYEINGRMYPDNGMSCAKILCDYHSENSDTEFPLCLVHSANPVGKENIMSYIKSYIFSNLL